MADDILERARIAAAQGWRPLGYLVNDSFREADMLWNPDDAMYYVAGTAATSNPPPLDPTTGDPEDPLTWGIYIWTIASSVPGNPTLITLDRPHIFALGQRQYALTLRNTGIGALNGTKFCSAPTQTTISVPANSTIPTAPGATIEWSVASPMVDIRRASTPEGLTGAVGDDYVPRGATQVYYPTWVRLGSGASAVWHMLGYAAGGASSVRRRYTGLSFTGPTNNKFLNPVTLPMTGDDVVGDLSVRYDPVRALYFMVGTVGSVRTELWSNPDITNDAGWVRVSTDVWLEAVPPSWATNPNRPDPNIAFHGENAYLLFTGGQVVDNWSTGIIALNVDTGRVIGTAVQLQEFGNYETWQTDGKVLSDLVLMDCPHDGVTRIFGFTNPAPDYVGRSYWGCLDLYPVTDDPGGTITGGDAMRDTVTLSDGKRDTVTMTASTRDVVSLTNALAGYQ